MTPPVYKRVLAVLLPLVLLGALGAAVALHLARAPGPDGYAGHTVLINEVCAKNLTGLTDADGNTGDWVELINVSGEDMVLDGWGLSDDPDRPFRWTFPEGTIIGGGANNILVIFADGQDGFDTAGSLHAKFSLARTGETLVLTSPDGTTVDELEYPSMEYDLTYGRLAGSADRVGVESGSLPVVSLTCEADDLFGPEGIYVAGQTYYTMRKYGSENPQGNFNGSEKMDGRLQTLSPRRQRSLAGGNHRAHLRRMEPPGRQAEKPAPETAG